MAWLWDRRMKLPLWGLAQRILGEVTDTPGYNRQDLVDICSFLNTEEIS